MLIIILHAVRWVEERFYIYESDKIQLCNLTLLNQYDEKIAPAFVNWWVVDSGRLFNVKLIFNLRVSVSERSNEELLFILGHLQIDAPLHFKWECKSMTLSPNHCNHNLPVV